MRLPSTLRMLAAVIAAGLALSLMTAQSVKANDSSASLDVGGLRLTYNPNIRILSEELFLSADEVRVAYRFQNVSDKDVSTLVAFPLPPLEIGEDGNYFFSGHDPMNVIDFQVFVEGPAGAQPAAPKIEMRANRFGVDVTDVLERYDIPLTMIAADDAADQALRARLANLPEAARAELQRYGVIDWNTSWGGDGKPFANTHWQTQITYYWFQVFPAGQSIEVTHRYHPVPRHFIFTDSDLADKRLRQDYCLDKAFISGSQKRLRASKMAALRGVELKYVLSTAGNWLGPIGKLHLIVEKPSPDALVSLCLDGIKRTSDTKFELTAEQYQPNEDFRVLFVRDVPGD